MYECVYWLPLTTDSGVITTNGGIVSTQQRAILPHEKRGRSEQLRDYLLARNMTCIFYSFPNLFKLNRVKAKILLCLEIDSE